MNRENLYIVAGALLASTALSTSAFAGTWTASATVTLGTTTTSATAKALSSQVFASTPSTTTVLGPVGLAYRFNQAMTSKFSLVANVTGAKISTANSINNTVDVFGVFGTSTAASTIVSLAGQGTLGCQVAVATEKILLTDCQPGVSAFSLTGLVISAVAFDNATALATAGASISVDASVTVGGIGFETTAAQAIITSRDSVSATVTAATAAATGTIDVGATPAFSKLTTTGSTQSVVIGTFALTSTLALAANISSVLDTSAEIHNGINIKLTSPIFSDDATKRVLLSYSAAGIDVRTSTAFATGAVTFTITPASTTITDTFAVQVEFNGTSVIDTAAAGSVDIAYTALGAASAIVNNAAPPSVAAASGLAGLARNGLSIDINGIQPGTAQGARTYTSLLRIANTGTTAGTVSVRLVNEATGATLGTYTSASIPVGASIQVSSATMEAGAGITAVASIGYRATVTGNINGYVQHVNWNQDAGFFSDLSGRRQ